MILVFAGLISGAASLYSLGTYEFPNNTAIPTVFLESKEVAMIFFFIGVSVCLIFFFVGCNNFLLCSAVSVWYFSDVDWSEGAPCGDSLQRLVRFHTGSVFFAGIIHGLLFVAKVLANVFSLEGLESDNKLVACVVECFNSLFCLFKM